MKRLLIFLSFFILFTPALAVGGEVCTVYFTYTSCHNCQYTDPVVLGEWPKKNDDLVIIEYVFTDWRDENAYLLGLYAQKYGYAASVPRLIINENKAAAGLLSVPNSESDIASMNNNPCLLLTGQVSFSELDLNELIGKPKLWAGNRLLVRLSKSNISSDFLKELLFSLNLSKTINESSYEIKQVSAEPALIAYGQIDFTNAVKIGDSWILKFNEDIDGISQDVEEENATKEELISLPFLGEVNATQLSLPVLTLMIAGADAFNPCAFFILTFLLSAMLYARSRKRIFIVGVIFLFFSGLIYFLFMIAWLNVFLIVQEIMLLTIIAGVIALIAGVLNIKDYFFFQKGISLTLPKSEKLKFFKKVKDLTQSQSFPALIIGTTILAVTINMYELLCTVGFPMVYTRILIMHELSTLQYYLYLVFYNLIYVTPLAIIVLVFGATLGTREFSKKSVRKLKLVSGLMILFLGLILLFNPTLLDNVFTGFTLIIFSLLIAGLIMLLKKIKIILK